MPLSPGLGWRLTAVTAATLTEPTEARPPVAGGHDLAAAAIFWSGPRPSPAKSPCLPCLPPQGTALLPRHLFATRPWSWPPSAVWSRRLSPFFTPVWSPRLPLWVPVRGTRYPPATLPRRPTRDRATGPGPFTASRQRHGPRPPSLVRGTALLSASLRRMALSPGPNLRQGLALPCCLSSFSTAQQNGDDDCASMRMILIDKWKKEREGSNGHRPRGTFLGQGACHCRLRASYGDRCPPVAVASSIALSQTQAVHTN